MLCCSLFLFQVRLIEGPLSTASTFHRQRLQSACQRPRAAGPYGGLGLPSTRKNQKFLMASPPWQAQHKVKSPSKNLAVRCNLPNVHGPCRGPNAPVRSMLSRRSHLAVHRPKTLRLSLRANLANSTTPWIGRQAHSVRAPCSTSENLGRKKRKSFSPTVLLHPSCNSEHYWWPHFKWGSRPRKLKKKIPSPTRKQLELSSSVMEARGRGGRSMLWMQQQYSSLSAPHLHTCTYSEVEL